MRRIEVFGQLVDTLPTGDPVVDESECAKLGGYHLVLRAKINQPGDTRSRARTKHPKSPKSYESSTSATRSRERATRFGIPTVTLANAASTPGEPVVPSIDRIELLETQNRFKALNESRLERLRKLLGARQQLFFEILPLLFHSNHPLLPGYKDADMPHGVSNYTPSQAALRGASRIAKTFKPKAPLAPKIHAIFLMGSSASVAHATNSDFDFWLCHDEKLSPEDIQRLESKAQGISEWAQSLKLEVHFFLMADINFKNQGAGNLSSESSGTTQHYLLLDEFYRTGLLIAGFPPLWWLIPPSWEHDYETYADQLKERRFIPHEEYVDFGPVANIPPGEFFGATLWQMSKALTAPHKSLLKILLLECYAAEFPDVDLLSTRFKRAVYEGETDLNRLDPYILLLEKVEERLASQNDTERTELARRCLYFKAGSTFIHDHDKRAAGTGDWRSDAVRQLVERWDWSREYVETMDQRPGWKIDLTLGERRTVVKALTRSYRLLSMFAREYKDSGCISDRDLTILGRRLFTAFQHKAGKVELVQHAISEDLRETHLTLHKLSKPEEPESWLLFRGKPDPDGKPVGEAVKRSWNLVEMIAWVFFNGLISSSTRLSVLGPNNERIRANIEHACEHLTRHCRAHLMAPAAVESFAHSPRLVAAAIFVNLSQDPMSSRSQRGQQITTSRDDALSYSGWHENLVREVDYLVITSWHEVLTFRYSGIEGLMDCLCEHLKWAKRRQSTQDTDDQGLAATVCSPGYEQTITPRLSRLLSDSETWFRATKPDEQHLYVIRGEDQFWALDAESGGPKHRFSGSFDELTAYLGQPCAKFKQVIFDPYALDDPLIGMLYERNEPGVVQFYYHSVGNAAWVHVIDEKGCLFVDRVGFHSEAVLVGKYQRFFESVQIRQNILLPSGLSEADALNQAITLLSEEPELPSPMRYAFHRAEQGHGKTYRIHNAHTPIDQQRDFLDVHVIAETVDGELSFTLYCNHREFSAREHGTRCYSEVTKYILSERRSLQPYPVYITDVDLSQLPVEEGDELQTIHYLRYKQRIEHKLNRSLEENAFRLGRWLNRGKRGKDDRSNG